MVQPPRVEIQSHHHVTLCVGAAQEDYDFHTGVLSLKSVKKTALYDGTHPIYHLYYGNDLGEESTLVTCFPMRQSGRMGRRGSGQISVLALSVPRLALGYWEQRLSGAGLAVKQSERFGERLLRFQHPCGIDYELVGIEDDDRRPYSNGEVPAELAIRGTHGVTVSATSTIASDEFLSAGWSARRLASDGSHTRYIFGGGGSGKIVDLLLEPSRSQGSWSFGEGTVHHCAFAVRDFAAQDAVKANLEGLGFTDVSERKDRGYFSSIYVRMPGGALFEATVSGQEGFLCRGNFRSAWVAEGGYEPVAEVLFSELAVDGIFLEYDDARSGDFSPLRFIPRDRMVVLGLVTTKVGVLESKDELKRRIEAAARYVPLEQLCLSPQCGFSSSVHGNEITTQYQEAKLRLVVDTAREVWGEH